MTPSNPQKLSSETVNSQFDWDDTVQLIVDVLKKHKVIMRDNVLFDLQAKESLATDIIEKLDDLWSKSPKDKGGSK